MTDKQKQCLLEYLGCYAPQNSSRVNNVDGLWGAKSKAATKKLQAALGLAATGVFDEKTEAKAREAVAAGELPAFDWSKVKYFKRSEFACRCGQYCDGFPAEMDPTLLAVADRVRAHFGAAAMVSSGVRCSRHNANVGGIANSRHLSGCAMDFRISGRTAGEVLAYVKQQPEISYAYAIDSYYVHMDVQ